jgi:hypothetical protein
MRKQGVPELINLPIADPAPWDDVRTVLIPAEKPAAPGPVTASGPAAKNLAAFLNGMRGRALRRYWAAVVRELDPPVRAALRQQLGETHPEP